MIYNQFFRHVILTLHDMYVDAVQAFWRAWLTFVMMFCSIVPRPSVIRSFVSADTTDGHTGTDRVTSRQRRIDCTHIIQYAYWRTPNPSSSNLYLLLKRYLCNNPSILTTYYVTPTGNLSCYVYDFKTDTELLTDIQTDRLPLSTGKLLHFTEEM